MSTADALGMAEQRLGVAFPEDYRTLLAEQGKVGEFFPPADDYLELYPADELAGINEAAGLGDRLPGCVVIGGDGSREMLVYDFRSQPPGLFMVETTAEDWSEAVRQADCLSDFMAQFPEQGWVWE